MAAGRVVAGERRLYSWFDGGGGGGVAELPEVGFRGGGAGGATSLKFDGDGEYCPVLARLAHVTC